MKKGGLLGFREEILWREVYLLETNRRKIWIFWEKLLVENLVTEFDYVDYFRLFKQATIQY